MGDLTVGQPVTRELASEQPSSYLVELQAGQFVLAVAEQLSVDVAIKVYDPDGAELAHVDRAHKVHGHEVVTWFSERDGAHRIEIYPGDEKSTSGRYALTLKRVEAAAQSPERQIDQLLSYWNRPERPGGAVAVVRNGKVVYQRGVGSANLEYGVPITPSTQFRIASASKQFTAFAATLLAQQGKLSLDDDIRKYVPEVPDFGTVITVRNLIYHTSGLRDQLALNALSGKRWDDVSTQQHILTMVSNQTALNFEPGSKFVYSNTGYTLLAEVVARATGTSFRQWTSDAIFAPLGMDKSYFHDNHEELVPGLAYSYSMAPDGSGFHKTILNASDVGASGLLTTVEDLAKWMINFDSGTVGGAAVVAQVEKRGMLNGDEISYASGLYHGDYRGVRTIGHGGALASYRSSLMRFPEHDLAIVVLSNGGVPAGSTADAIAGIYLREHLNKSEANQKETAASASTAGKVALSNTELDAVVGKFRLDNGMSATISRVGEQLMVQLQGMPAMPMTAESKTAFSIAALSARVELQIGPGGAVESLMFIGGGMKVPGTRVKPAPPSAAALNVYTGVYFSPEIETFYTIRVKGDRLVAYQRDNGEIPLSPEEADTFSSDEWYFDKIVFTRKGEAITGMLVSNARIHNVRFERRLD